MLTTKRAIGATCFAAMAAASLAGCGNNSTGADMGGVVGGGCAPKASCPAVDKTCLGLVDNSGKTKFGLRMAEIDFTSPVSLTTGIVKTVFAGNATPNNKSCLLDGSATFSWLLQFDTAAGTLKTGGAKPVADASQGYSFDDEMITQGAKTFHVEPIAFPGITPDPSGHFSVTTGQDLLMPVFLDETGTSVVLLPLHQARLTNGTLSSNNNCVGNYNAAGLSPANACNPDDTHPQFITGGSLEGYITLEEADTVIIAASSQSLCVLLSGNSTTYGMTSVSNISVCKRDNNGKILYQGAWCSTTNAAADGTCADAEQLKANFAASSILINN